MILLGIYQFCQILKIKAVKKINFLFLILITLSAISVSSQNAPITTATTVKSNGPSFIVPIKVANFNNIGNFRLTLHYDPAIVTATNVAVGPLFVNGNLALNMTAPGVIVINWLSTLIGGQTHPDNSVLLNISFNRIQPGTSALTWYDNGSSCAWRNGSNVLLNDSPTSTYYINGSILDHFAPVTIASSALSCPGSMVSIPVSVSDFYSIGSVSLRMNYNSSVITYHSTTTNPAYLINVNGSIPGAIVAAGSSMTGTTLPDNTVLFTLNFLYNGGSTELNWYDDGESCEYADAQLEVLPDSPQPLYYINGFVGPGNSTQWNGNTDTQWAEDDNWSCGIPHSGSNVIIPITPHNPVISSSVVINSLTIDNGASLTLNPEASLTVSSTITNNAGNGGLLLKSSATATASLIHYNTGVSATVERFIAKYNVINDFMFHFISSPVVSQLIQPEFVTSNPNPTYGHDFYAFSEPENMWINTKADDGSWNNMFENKFLVGKGYLIAYDTDVTKTFTGELNSFPASSPLEQSCTNTALRGEGWNLLGNPFPSALDWNLLTRGEGIDSALYYYNNDAENYQYFLPLPGLGSGYIGNGSQYIPPMQGFMVHAKSTGTKTVSISNAARTHSGKDTYYKSGQSVPGSMSLTVSINGKKDETFIHFNNQATTAFDGEYDAYKLKSYSSEVPKIYTKGSDNNELAINGLPELSGDMTIPVYFEAAIEGTYTLTANLEQLQGTQVLLEDKTENITRNISQNPVYTFSASPGENANRFILKFGSVGIGDIDPDADIKIYTVDKNIVINAPESSKLDITVYNLTGQLMLSSKSNGGQITLPAGNLSKGVYLVSVVNNGKVVNRKIVISQ